jgi:hypothetical protein
LLVLCAVAIPPAGCGGGSGGDEGAEPGEAAGELSEEQREEAEREQAAEQVPEADRLAYYQVATSSGLLRAWAQAVSRGEQPPERAGDAKLRAAERRLAELDAEDPGLDRLVNRLLRALRGATGHDPAQARRLVRESDAVNAGLQRYLKRTPVISILIPD